MKPEDLERIVRSVGMDAGLMDMGAASCIYSDGCEGVTMADFQRLADAIEAHVLSQHAQGAEVDEAVRKPLTESRLFVLLNQCITPPPARLPPGYVAFARAIEQDHDITNSTKGDAR